MLRIDKQRGFSVVWIVVIVLIVLLLGWWIFGGSSTQAPTVGDNVVQEEIVDSEAASIASDLEGLDTLDLEAEFSDIEADLNQL